MRAEHPGKCSFPSYRCTSFSMCSECRELCEKSRVAGKPCGRESRVGGLAGIGHAGVKAVMGRAAVIAWRAWKAWRGWAQGPDGKSWVRESDGKVWARGASREGPCCDSQIGLTGEERERMRFRFSEPIRLGFRLKLSCLEIAACSFRLKLSFLEVAAVRFG